MEHIGLYLKDIYNSQQTGQLYFQRGYARKHLYFQDGSLVYARTNQPQELIGEVLHRLGKVSDETFQKIDAYIMPKRTIGEVLIAEGLITQESLVEGLMYQFREVALNSFAVFDASFKFREGSPFEGETFDVKIGIPVLIEEGIRRMKFDPNLQAFLSGRTPRPHDKTFFLKLTEEEKDIYAAVTGQLTSDSILEKGGFNPEAFWKSIFLFFCLGLIDLEGEAQGWSQEPSESEERAEDALLNDEKVRDVVALYERLSELDYYQVLNVDSDTEVDAIKKTYFQLARKYHPDLFGRGLPENIKQKIDEVFDYITKAYHTLCDEDAKAAYDKQKDKPKPKAGDARDDTKRAEMKFRQGKTLYDQTRFDEAVIMLQEAIRLDSNKSQYFLLLALTQSKIKQFQKKSVKNFQKAIELEPWSPDAYVGLGALYRKEGMPVMAAKYLKKALQVDPDHSAANKELAELEGKKEKKGLKDLISFDPKDLKNIFKKDLFKKK
jgi:tetratricopeptide (TPR) repeat protein